MDYRIEGKFTSQEMTLIHNMLMWHGMHNESTIYLLWNEHGKLVLASNYLDKFMDINSLGKMSWKDVIPESSHEQILNHFAKTTNQMVIPQMILTNKQGDSVYFNALIDLINIEGKKYNICRLTNESDIKVLKEMLLEAEKLKLVGELSAGLVHEIRNPLTSLKGFLQLVQAGVAQKEEYYKVMIDEVEKLEEITSELLCLAKRNSNAHTIAMMDKLISEVLFLLNTQSSMRNITITHRLDKELSVLCNPGEIKQVLFNIIKNGAEAMNMTGRLTINAYRKNNQVVVEVIDEGKGIPADQIAELTKPFFTTKSYGTGLGLMITTHILEAHQGQLEIASDEGKGTMFRILLPIDSSKN